MNLLNSSSPLVMLVILLLASNFMPGHMQEITRAGDVTVPDSELDPMDIQDYDLENENRQPVITTKIAEQPSPDKTTPRSEKTSTVEKTTTTVGTTTEKRKTSTTVETTTEKKTPTTVETTTMKRTTTTVETTTEEEITTTDEETTVTVRTTTEKETTTKESTTEETTTEETTASENVETTTLHAKVMRKKPAKIKLDTNAIEYIVSSNKYQDLKIEKTVDEKQTLAYVLRASDPSYQIQLNVFTESHIDFRECAISYQTDMQQQPQCLQSYVQIINSDFVVKINTDALPNAIKLRVRLVISGCDEAPNRIRDIELAYGVGLPNIYHNSDQECIYRIVNSNLRRSMVKVTLFEFPLKQDKVCHAHVQVSSGDNEQDIDRKVQVKFDSLESFEPFQSGIMVAAKYTFVKVINCFENDPVEIAVDAIRRAVGSIKLNEKKTYYQFDSDLIASPSQDSYVVAEIQNENFRNMLSYRLDYVIDQRKLANCGKENYHNTSLVTVYGVNEQDRMLVRQFYPCSYEAPLASEELLGIKYLFVQFYRETKNPSVDMSADKIIMYFNLKTVQTKYLTLTEKSGRITSDDYDSVYLRNYQLDFEIKAPQGHRILLNLTRFNNGKANVDEQTCDDFILVRLNKTTVRESTSFYEMNSNPKFCNSLGPRQPFVLMSSYTNTLLVTIFFKQLDSTQAELEFPHFEFTYQTEPFCGNQFTNRSVPLISFSSLQSLGDQRQCNNMIYVGRQKRIVVYKIDWLSYYSNDLIENDEIDVNYMNGRVVCAQTDSLHISNDDVKYENLFLNTDNNNNNNNIYNVYCMNNPFRAFVSERNKVFLTYKTYSANTSHKSELAQTLVRPLVFDIGYFSYKHLYDDYDREVDLDFGSLIPANVGSKTRLNNLEVKISLSNRTNYIVPVIRDCYLRIDQGEILLKTSSRSIRLNLDCANQSYTSMFSMEHELKLEFRNVLLSELRDKRIRLRIEYTLKPKVFSAPTGTFDSTGDLNTQHNHLSMSKDRVEYEWLIDVAANHLVRLSIDELKNEMNIAELSILDARTNVRLYDQNELLDNYRNGRGRAYLFATNRVKVVFKHERDQRKRAVDYPYLKCSYTTEAKLITANASGVINHVPGYSKSRIEWMILAPVEHVIVVKMLDYQAARESNGQIKFSLLNTGTYHFNLNEKPDEPTYDRPTDIVVSKSNMISLEYMPGGVNDQFKLEYSVVRNVYVQPAGLIRQRYNELTRPVVYVPKWADQSWTVRAPYTKQIVVYTKYVDLMQETVCSKTSVNFYESNGTRIFSECGNYELDKFDLRSSFTLLSDSNELTVNFVTQNTNEVVYSRPQPGRDGNLHVYKGFLFYYAFLETPGDCYFQQRRNPLCGYEPVGAGKWVIIGDAARVPKDEYEIEFDKHICANCYVSAHVPVQVEEKHVASTLVSPVIERNKNMLEFDYQLSGRAKLSVKFVYSGAAQEPVLLTVYNQTTDGKWTRAKVRIGTRLLHDYKIMFVLEKSQIDQVGTEMPTVSLDNIQLFERDFECVMNMDETCLAARELTQLITAGHHLTGGKFCQPYMTPCDSNKCQNGAVCVNKHLPNRFNATLKNQLMENTIEWDEEYTCECLPGFTGVHCETRLDPCEPTTTRCSVNGTLECQSKLNSYECKCKDGYFGKYCEQKIKPCKLVENPCNQRTQQGVCQDLDVNKFFCVCAPMYTGTNCEQVINQRCLNSGCNLFDANATCIELHDRYVCRCSPGFEGPMCTNIDDCVNSPCRNNGTCIDGINSFQCKCTENYDGKYCENSRVCSQCNPLGTLSCDPNQAKCLCKETHGGLFCDVELDPCLEMPCVNGECVSNKVNKFECVCNSGWKGHLCDRKEDICDQGLCQNGATCMIEKDINTDDINYFCSCAPGFEGRNCEHMINQCSSLDPCKNGATCISSVNNYTCICPPNYEGRNCDFQIDYCQLRGKCAYGSTCHSVINGYICKCPPGRYGRHCDEEVDKCLENECQNGRCVPNELDAGYTCQCMPGFGGKLCEVNVDDCESSPCESGATCVDLVDSYRCLCPPGRTGRNCQDTVDYCSDISTRCHPKHTRQCIPIPGGVKCDCLGGFTGVKCESPIDLCDFVKPCRTGECVMNETAGDYECRGCAEGYGGKNCSQLIDFCETMKPCHNDAKCLSKPNDYHCVCSETFRGKNCDIPVEPVCVDNKCVNNSTCVADKDGLAYKCECQGDYEGWYCEKKRNKCQGVDCKYGYCVDGKCECDPKIPMCNSECKLKNVVCENGGKCVDVIKGAKVEAYCLCPPGLTGTFCEESVYCSSPRVRPCGPNHQCVTVNQSYECHCDSPLIGHGCSKKLDDFVPAYETFIKQEKFSSVKQQCRFGHSKESKILIAAVVIGSVILLIIGLMFGHCSVNSYKKRYEAASSLNSKSNYSVMSSATGATASGQSSIKGSNPNLYRTPVRSMNAHEITLNKSSAFSIPRPSVHL